MTRNEALATAKINHKAHRKAVIDHLFGRAATLDEASFGFRHGWYQVGNFNFSQDEITGQAYDHTQGGWAHL